MCQKCLLVLILTLCCFTIGSFGLAAGTDFKVRLNDRPVVFDVPPRLENGRFLVPLRPVLEAMGANVSWHEDTNTAIASLPGITIVAAKGSKSARINGRDFPLAVAAEISNGRLIVPLQLVTEATGAQSAWDGAARTLSLLVKDLAFENESNKNQAPALNITPLKALAGEPWSIKVSGLVPGAAVTLIAEQQKDDGVKWESHAVFHADSNGAVDTGVQAPVSGTYEGTDQAGLFWSMRPVSGEKPAGTFAKSLEPQKITVCVEVEGERILSQEVERLYLLPGVKRMEVRESGVVGTLFIPAGEGKRPAIIVLGGADGGTYEPAAAIYASHGYVALALAYFGMEGLPDSLVDIPVETVERATHWLEVHPGVDQNAIGIWGASKGAELALLAASHYPQIKAVVAKSPSAVVFEGISQDTGRNHKSSWSFKGEPVSFVPYAFTRQLAESYSSAVAKKEPWSTAPMYEYALQNKEAVERAAIKVENINGPVLLVSGSRDGVWPAGKMSEMIINRLREKKHPFADQHLHYKNAGHQISAPYSPTTVNWLTLPGDFIEDLGGSPGGNAAASMDSWPKIINFFRIHLDSSIQMDLRYATANNFTGQAELDRLISNMTLEEKIGQMLMVSFRKWKEQDVTEINSEIAGIIKKYHLGGVILFRENVPGTGQTARLADQLQKAAGDIPLFIAIDQEGGLVTRLQSGTTMPGNMALGAARCPENAYEVAKAIGEELNALGINVDLAPVVDVNINPDNPVIGIRSFGSDPQLVADMGVAYINGLRDAGILATVKHFPGHGDTDVDSHLGLPSVPHDLTRLKEVELKPFQQAFDQGVDMVMTAHVTFPAIDHTKAVSKKDGGEISIPATLSYQVLTNLVREEMGFDGVIITDALEMKAIADHFGPREAVIMAVKAGADIALMPADLDQAYQGLLAAVKGGEIPETRIDQSVKRLMYLKLSGGIVKISGGKFVPGDKVTRDLDERIKIARAVVGSAAHREIEKKVAEKAVTLLKNEGNILPFKLADGKNIVLFAPWDDRLDLMARELDRIIAEKGFRNVNIKGFVYKELTALTDEQKQAMDAADYVVLGSYSYNVLSRTPGKHWAPDFALSVARYALPAGKPLAVMAIRNPYDIMYMPGVKAYLAVYGAAQGPNIPAGIDVIFGQARPRGKLPVSIPNSSGTGVLYVAGAGLVFK